MNILPHNHNASHCKSWTTKPHKNIDMTRYGQQGTPKDSQYGPLCRTSGHMVYHPPSFPLTSLQRQKPWSTVSSTKPAGYEAHRLMENSRAADRHATPATSASYLVQVNQLRGVKISINVAKNYRILPQNVDLYVRHDYLLTVLHSLSLRGPVLVLRAENECTTTGEGYIGPSTSLSLDNLREYIARKTTTVVKHNWNCVQARKWVAVLLFSGIILPNMAIVGIGRYAQSYDRIQDTRTLYYLPWESLLQSKWN